MTVLRIVWLQDCLTVCFWLELSLILVFLVNPYCMNALTLDYITKSIQQSTLLWLGITARGKGGLQALSPNTLWDILSSPHYAWQDKAETWEHRVDSGYEQCFLRSFCFIFSVAVRVCRLFLVVMTNFFVLYENINFNLPELASSIQKRWTSIFLWLRLFPHS